MCLYPTTQNLGTRGGSERGGGSEASARSGRGETGHPAAPTRVAGRRGGAPAWPSWLAPTRGQGSPSPLRPPALRSSEAHVLLEPESGCSADRADRSTSVRQAAASPRHRRRPGHGQQGGRGRPGRPLSPSSSPVFTPLARTLASPSAKVSCRTRSRSHTRLEGASCLCLPLPAPKISVPQEGFPRRNRGFFFSFGWEQTVFSTSEKHKEQKTKTRGNMAGAGFRPAHPPTRLLVGVRYGPARRRRCSGAGDRAVNGTGHPRPSRSLRSTQGIAG